MKLLLLVIALFFLTQAYPQNLIANSSFEDENYCEAHIPCSPAAWYSVYNMPYGYDNNNDNIYKGKHTLGFLVLLKKENIRTYWQTMLLCSLEKGKEYELKFYLLSPDIKFNAELFGAFFCDSLIYLQKDTLLNYAEALKIKSTYITTTKKNGWLEISLRFNANGNEKILVLGNFSDKNNPGLLVAYPQNKYVEYYIDNISLLPIQNPKNKCTGYQFRLDSLYASKIRHKHFENYVVKEAPPVPTQTREPLLQSQTVYRY